MIQLRNRPGRHTAGRTLLITALLAAAVVPAAAAAPPAPTAPVTERSTAPAPAYQQVAHFYGAYIDAAGTEGGGTLTTALRAFYLTPALRSQLRTWEARNHADGVLRAQNTPLDFKITPGDSGAGHTWSKVRLTWSGGQHPTYTWLTVQSDLRTGRISGIR
ncbi:hypothetical protein [Streptomyces sp. NBC_01727]|uniref:hypothetical protein n=1 Tax=unclassified Streptomyces TaxID=2593676 RepID=UPI002E0F3857|nr:hypothetical protein OIE76_15280 [Streptomyces sp. NBC_01727]